MFGRSVSLCSKSTHLLDIYFEGFPTSGAAQSNPKFQISSLEQGYVETLLKITALDPEADVSTKSFSALSAIIRDFPQAQNSLLRQGGLGGLKFLYFYGMENSFKSVPKSFVLKVLSNFVFDFIFFSFTV